MQEYKLGDKVKLRWGGGEREGEITGKTVQGSAVTNYMVKIQPSSTYSIFATTHYAIVTPGDILGPLRGQSIEFNCDCGASPTNQPGHSWWCSAEIKL